MTTSQIADLLKVQSGPFKGKPQIWFTRAEVQRIIRALLAQPASSLIAQRKVDELRADGFTDYDVCAVLRKDSRYCIVGALGDVRWHGQPAVAPPAPGGDVQMLITLVRKLPASWDGRYDKALKRFEAALFATLQSTQAPPAAQGDAP